MTRYLLLMLISASTLCLSAQSKTKSHLDLTKGRQAYLKKNYWGALTHYRKALKGNPDNALVNYRIGETQYALKHYGTAKTYLTKAVELDKEVDIDLDLMLGYVHHRLGELEEAKSHYRAYRDVISEGRGRLVNISGLIDQCDYAREMMAQPVDVEIKNLGREINSRNDDYAPSITANGQLLVFTSRRASVSNEVDELGDYKYFEDIYYSTWDRESESWEPAERMSEAVNTPSHDAVLSINKSGTELFIYKNDQGNAGDIFRSLKQKNEWSEPKKLSRPINTSYFESSISLTADGNTMYFISERPGGLGRGDIYMSRKTGETSWSKPENLGMKVNTPFDEKFVFIHPNGNTLFFASKGHLTMGSYDIFRTEYVDGEWTEPVNLGYPINTVNEESTFSMTSDNKKLLISAEYDNGIGERDIYEIDISSTDILHSLNIDSELLEKQGNVTLFGKISKERGQKPAAFVEVSVMDAKGEEEIYTTKTDRRGLYEVSLPRDESYLIIVTQDGKEDKTKVSLKGLESYESEWQQDIDL